VSASPELFLRRTERSVHTAPVKGTAPAGDAAALAVSAKDRAENVMIVDLMRNDLGRVCEFGSVRVGPLAQARPGAGVTHLVSEVTGTLRPGVGNGELLRATFPPGSVTGAPKVQSLRVIAELEGAAREVYTGAIGYASPVAGLELSVAIRTFELVGERLQLGVGGGITAASDPELELEECLVKARPLLALGGAGAPGAAGAADRRAVGIPIARTVPRALAEGRERPDPARGVFETVRVRDGAAERLPAHLARLAGAAAAIGTSVPAGLGAQIAQTIRDRGSARLRIDLGADGEAALALGPLPGARGGPGAHDGEIRMSPTPWGSSGSHGGVGRIVLAPCLLPGGLGAHKWRDRRLLDALEAALGAVPLLVDGDGAVLEAAWASVWVQEGDRLVTPPADGRILPGITRAALLAEDPRCAEGPVDLERLHRADAVWVSSALRGLVPARVTDPLSRS
jgi:para-aminobenzoate synthetase/4-amino-4-deoxychorismate lyase